ncbi:MAG TPA: gluconokinase, GntK/IdnK-type [Acidimicrobiia bacterium]|nr:gluconokinase, GntK/IdnK-type [Acidimicrobiia bacterium]
MVTARIVLIGVTGSGKTTVGRVLATRLGAPFLDGDDFHSPEAIAAMRTGCPLDDADRAPWLERVRAALHDVGDGPVVLACSALKRAYREVLRDGVADLTFVDLEVGPETLARRVDARTGHFAGIELLPSQLDALELGDDVVRVDGSGTPEEVADRVLLAANVAGQA